MSDGAYGFVGLRIRAARLLLALLGLVVAPAGCATVPTTASTVVQAPRAALPAASVIADGAPPVAVAAAGSSVVAASPPQPAPASGALSVKADDPPLGAPAGPAECALLHVEAQLRQARHQVERARAALLLGRARCPADRGFAAELGDLHAVSGDLEGAAAHYITAVTGPDPPETAFRHLARIYRRLRPTTRDRIRALGGSAVAPLFVPSIGHEYAWVATFACAGGQGRVAEQSLVGADGQIDRLRCVCPDGSDRALFFDFSADPDERQMKIELRLMLEEDQAEGLSSSPPAHPGPRRQARRAR